VVLDQLSHYQRLNRGRAIAQAVSRRLPTAEGLGGFELATSREKAALPLHTDHGHQRTPTL
jgi:hypothetical protein